MSTKRARDRAHWLCLGRMLGAAMTVGAVAGVLGVDASALAEETPRAGSLDTRVRVVNYSEWQVYSLTTSLRSILTVEVSPDETIRNVALGDTVSWEVALVGNLLFVKQREEAKRTNAVVTSVLPSGALRSYQFEFNGEAGEPSMVKVKFQYPGQVAEERRKAEARAAELEHGRLMSAEVTREAFTGTPNYRYSISGSADFAPSDAWDNGRVTIFRFAGQTQLPAIYAVSKEGEERQVQVAMQGDLAVVGTVAPAWRMRMGSAVVCLWNEAYAPAWAPRDGGTAGETFTRTIKVNNE
jgi:type IV secretion system protein VirB9